MPELDPMKRWLTWTVYATPSPLMTLTADLGLSIRVSMFEHVDWWLGPLSRSPGMGEGGDCWSWQMCVIAKGIPRGCQGLSTPVSLGYPLSVFNKNSTLKTSFVQWTWPVNLMPTRSWSPNWQSAVIWDLVRGVQSWEGAARKRGRVSRYTICT